MPNDIWWKAQPCDGGLRHSDPKTSLVHILYDLLSFHDLEEACDKKDHNIIVNAVQSTLRPVRRE